MKRLREEHKEELRELVECHKGLAEAYVAQRNTAEALQHFDQSIELQPDDPDCWLRLRSVLSPSTARLRQSGR